MADAPETRVLITPDSEEHWLSMRAQDVTSTEVSALFSCHSYGLTEWQLYHQKSGNITPEWKDSDRMKWGRRMEATIAAGIAEDAGLIVQPLKDYGRIIELRMGSSFDFKVVGLAEGFDGDERYRDIFREHGPGLMEVKNVDGMVFYRSWEQDGENIEAPPQIEFQIQHELEVAGLGWCLGAPLINGNTPKPFYRIRDKEIGDAIKSKVSEFWNMVDQGVEPDPDYIKDADEISRMYLNSSDAVIDMSDNDRFRELCEEYELASAQGKDADQRKLAVKAEMLIMLGDNAKAFNGEFGVSASTVKEGQGTLITPQMVGTRIGGRSSYRGFRVTRKKKA